MHIYRKLNQLIDREATKKRNLSNTGDVSNALSSIAAYSRSHRDRSHTQPIQMRNSLHGQYVFLVLFPAFAFCCTAWLILTVCSLEEESPPSDTETPIVVPVPVRNNITHFAPRDRRNLLMERKGTVTSFEEDGTRLQTPQLAAIAHLRPRGSLGNPTTIDLLGRSVDDRDRLTLHSFLLALDI